jgi:hypothetical protein
MPGESDKTAHQSEHEDNGRPHQTTANGFIAQQMRVEKGQQHRGEKTKAEDNISGRDDVRDEVREVAAFVLRDRIKKNRVKYVLLKNLGSE